MGAQHTVVDLAEDDDKDQVDQGARVPAAA